MLATNRQTTSTNQQRRQDMMRWLLTHGREWVDYEKVGAFPFRISYSNDGLLIREVRETDANATVHYRITDAGIKLIGEIT